MHRGDAKSPLEIIHVNLLESLEYVNINLSVGKMVDCSEAYDATWHQEEWDLVHKEQICGQKYFLVELHELHGHFD
jgi:hypothetical protein